MSSQFSALSIPDETLVTLVTEIRGICRVRFFEAIILQQILLGQRNELSILKFG